MNARAPFVRLALAATLLAASRSPLSAQQQQPQGDGQGSGWNRIGAGSSGPVRSNVRIGNFNGGHLGASSFGDGSSPPNPQGPPAPDAAAHGDREPPTFSRRVGNTELQQWAVGAGVNTDPMYNYWAAWGTGVGMMQYLWGGGYGGYGMGYGMMPYALGESILGPYYASQGGMGQGGTGMPGMGMPGMGGAGMGMPGMPPNGNGGPNGNNGGQAGGATIGQFPGSAGEPNYGTPQPGSQAPSASSSGVPSTTAPTEEAPAPRPNPPETKPAPPPPAPMPNIGSGSASVETARQFSERGEKEFRANNFKAAAYQWKHALLDDPQNGMLTMLLAQALFAAGQYEDAATVTQHGMRLLPRDQWGIVITNRKELYREPVDYLNQLHTLDRLLKAKSGDATLRFLAGFHYACLGYPKAALEHLDKALAAGAQDPLVQNLRDEMQAKLPKPAAGRTPGAEGAPPTPAR